MSLKGGMSATELFDTIDEAKKGESKAIAKLEKLVENGVLSREEYGGFIFGCRLTETRKSRERSQKIKHIIWNAVAIVVVLESFGCTLGEFVVRYGKGIAVWYFFLCLALLGYYSSERASKLSKLKQENERLKSELERICNNHEK